MLALLIASRDAGWIVNCVGELQKHGDGKQNKKKSHLRSLRARLLVVARFTTQRAKVDPFLATFVPTADAVRLWPSGLSLDNGRFKRDRGNGQDVDRDDSKLVDSPKCTDAPLVDAEGLDINTSLESCRACVLARVTIVLELHVETPSPFQVHNTRCLASFARLDIGDGSRGMSGFKLPSRLPSA